jgi:hypothetical protein
MSHSYAKRFRWLKSSPVVKKYASRKVRRTRDFDVNGNAFKKLFESWDINDSGPSRPIPKHGDEVEPSPHSRGNWTPGYLSRMRRK